MKKTIKGLSIGAIVIGALTIFTGFSTAVAVFFLIGYGICVLVFLNREK